MQISVSVRVTHKPHFELHRMFHASFLWPWLGALLAALRYARYRSIKGDASRGVYSMPLIGRQHRSGGGV